MVIFSDGAFKDLLCSLPIIESTSNPNGEAAIACWNFTFEINLSNIGNIIKN